MRYKVVRGLRQMWDVVTSENEKTIIYCSRCFREEAERIAALLNASDGIATEAIEALGDGGLGRVVKERERLRAACEVLVRVADTAPPIELMRHLNESVVAARAVLADDA